MALSVAILEDDAGLRQDLVTFFEFKGVTAVGCEHGSELYPMIRAGFPDVLIVDLMLDDEYGLDIVKAARDQNYEGGVIVLTALSDTDTVVSSYDSGADIYLNKKADMNVIDACFRRLVGKAGKMSITTTEEDWILHTTGWELQKGNHSPVKLTAREMRILEQLMRSPGQAFERQALVGMNDGPITPEMERRVDSVISRLRRKIRDNLNFELPIDQVYGIGYAFTQGCKVQ